MKKSGTRRPHRKTRTGCKVCKGRKIKCDEQRPSCQNCVRHALRCDYLSFSSPAESLQDYQLHAGSSSNTAPQSGYSPLPNETFSPVQSLSQAPTLNLLHLELLHNYTTSTCFTMNNNPAMKTLWRIKVVQLGFAWDFVMNAILALSALHLSHFRPSKADFYISHARLLHQNGLRVVNSMLLSVTDTNCEAVYIFTALTCIITLALPRDPNDILLVHETGVAEWLTMFRGTRSIIANSEHVLLNGVLAPMFEAGRRRAAFRDVQTMSDMPEEEQLNELMDLISHKKIDTFDLQVYIDAISELRKSFTVVYAEGFQAYDSADVYVWLFRIADEFLVKLQQRTQESLVIFCFYCVVLKRFEGAWWMNGLSSHLMNRIYTLLDEEHRTWIRWPIEETGWIHDC